MTTQPLLASGSSITIPLPLHNQLYVSARASHFWVITLHIVFPQVVINDVRWSERLARGAARCIFKVTATCSRWSAGFVRNVGSRPPPGIDWSSRNNTNNNNNTFPVRGPVWPRGWVEV